MKGSGGPFAAPGVPAAIQLAPRLGLVSAKPEDSAHGSPSGKIMLLAEKIGKFLFETRFGPGMLLDKPGHRLP